MTFDPKTCRRNLKSVVLKVDYGITIEDASDQRAMGSWGCGMLNTGVECHLIGLLSDAHNLIAKAHAFLRRADQENEQNKVGAGIVLEQLALASWFVNQSTDTESLRRSVEWTEAWFAAEKTKPYPLNVQLSLPSYYEAQCYETVVARYESAGLKKPANIRRIKGEGTMCYVMARNRLGLEYSDEEIAEALEVFLKRSVKEWLGRDGAYATAARWMKIAHWERGDDPFANVLRCYDYLPGLKPPKYPPKKDS